MVNFSICLIARNEEKTLPRLLESLSKFKERGGEVVLVDTGSTDKTAQIARDWGCVVDEVGSRFLKNISIKEAIEIQNNFLVKGDEKNGAIVIPGETLFDFAEARNYCASLASNEMISMPDCDEIFTALDIPAVENIINQGYEQLEFNFVFAHGPNGEETIKFLQCKFYDRRKMSWVGVIHEVLQGEAKRIFLPESIFKIEHYQNVETNRDGYLKGLAYDCLKNPTNDRNSHYFGRELMYRGFTLSAIKEFERHLGLSKWDAERAQSMIFIGDCFMKLGATKASIQWYLKAFIEYSGKRESILKIAQYYRFKEDWRKCRFFAEGCLPIKYSGFYADNLADYNDEPLYEMLYLSCWYLGDKEDAKMYYDLAVQSSPSNSKFLHDRHFFYVDAYPTVSILIPTLGRPEGLKRCLDSIERLDYPKDKIEVIYEEDTNLIGVPKMLNKLFRQSTGEYIIYGSNDIEFAPPSIRNAMMYKEYDLVAFNTGNVTEDEGNICEHFMIKRSYVLDELHGQIFDEEFHHVGVDNLLWAMTKKKIRASLARIYHYHFSRTGKPMDEVYQRGWSKTVQDRELLTKKLKQYE